jgi:molecular chaperone DnaK (HSP70)
MDINTLIQNTHHQLVVFLEGKLFDICSEDWWGNCVRLKLTYAQEQILDEKNIDCLEKLDFAALLRVLNKNWWELKAKFNLSREGMTLVNEVMNIRNRYAHMSIEGVDLNDRLRDCDTLARFLVLIDADKKNIEEANKYHKKLIKQVASGYGEDESEKDKEINYHNPKEILPEVSFNVDLKEGVPESFIRPNIAVKDKNIISAMERAVFIGIDFGTSTTVVSMMEKNNDQLVSEPVSIVQWDKEGREVRDHLLPTCIAWHNKKLIVGRGALELKQQSQAAEGRNLWTEFKMKQGINTGPFPNTVLASKNGGLVIENPQDAVRTFFTFLQQAIEECIQSKKLPSRIYYSVSVPASFEANQRQDLIKSISDSGIQAEELNLIDEPNAAFLSHLFSVEKGMAGESFLDGMTERPRVVAVFDFGAGTCDISILKIAIKDNLVSSQNLAISEFISLGGRDIDHVIATKVLLPQLCGNSKPEDVFSTEEREVLIIPRLSAHAERLKIQCSKLINQRGLKKVEDLIRNDKSIVGRSIEPIVVRGKSWKLDNPTISLSQFSEIMKPFLASTKEGDEDENLSVLKPLQNAMDKADLSVNDLDMVLFIGGSCENPLVRTAIESYVGRFVDCVTPRDLRSHVSQGSAIHSLFAHGLGAELIRPIVSEPIYILTKDNVRKLVLDSGTPVPSEVPTITEYYADNQEYAEMPFYSGSQEKELGVIKIKIEKGGSKNKDKIKVSCAINHEKLLDVKVTINGNTQPSWFINPSSITKKSPAELEYLIAVKRLNIDRLNSPGRRPSAEAVQGVAIAAQNAKKWREAAEHYINAERLDPDIDHSTNICYSYAMAGDNKKSDRWSEKAFDRNPNSSIAAYNLALVRKHDRNISVYEELMLKSLELDPDNTATLSGYGHYLIDESRGQLGLKMINKAFDIFDDELNDDYLSESNYARFRQTANTLGKKSILRKLDNYQSEKERDKSSFDEKNLIIPVDKQETTGG